MREIEVVPSLHDVVGIFVADGEADAKHGAVVADHVEADNLALLAAVLRVAWKLDRLLGRDEPRAVALVRPFRLNADRARLRLSAFYPELEHLHGVGEVGTLQLGVHGVSRLRAAEMREPRQRHDDARRLRVVERQKQPLLSDQTVIVDLFAKAVRLDGCSERALGAMRFERQVTNARGSAYDPRHAVARNRRNGAGSVRAHELNETHVSSPAPRGPLPASILGFAPFLNLCRPDAGGGIGVGPRGK